MGQLPTSEFADKIGEMLPALMKPFLKMQTEGFYKIKITIPQLVVLDLLVRENELRMSDLARHVNVTTAAMTGVVDRLVRDGYAKRESDSADRRIIKVRPTAKGLKIVKHAAESKKAMIVKMFSVVSDSDREEYLRILTVIKDNIEERKG